METKGKDVMECFILSSGFLFLFSVCFTQISVVYPISTPASKDSAPTVEYPVSPPASKDSAPTVIVYPVSTSVSMANTTFYLNSSLPSTWYNNNSTNMTLSGDDGSTLRVVLASLSNVGFYCGFYCIDSCNYYLFSLVLVQGGDVIDVVWSANTKNPVPENATLGFTRDGDLELRDSEGVKVWSTNTSGKSVMGMNITESGNLVLFDSKGRFIWQSFDHPTDTLLPGQRLNEGQRLTVTASKSNWSDGLYYATLTSKKGFAAYTKVDEGRPQMYYQLMPNPSSSTTNAIEGSNYAEFRRSGLFVRLGSDQISVWKYINFSFGKLVIPYLRLESDGHLKIYQFEDYSGRRTELLDIVGHDSGGCQYPRSCGDYGVCREGQCSCPVSSDGTEYFRPTQFQLPNGGCSRITPLSCQRFPDQHHLIELRNATYFSTIDSDAALPNIKSLEGCKQACLQNCSCNAAFFRYEKNISDGYCYTPNNVLSLREDPIPSSTLSGSRSTAYVKVQIPNPPLRKRTNLAAIIAGAVGGAFFVTFVVIFTLVILRKWDNDAEEDYIGQFPGMPMRFTYEELRVATDNFKEKLGSGGFGTVFKGVIRDGTNVAVKRLDRMTAGMREFLAEVESIGSIHHFNLTRLIGFCAEKSDRLLVYEFMSNGSLDNWIFNKGNGQFLDWRTQKKIILDIAKGMAYLHEECRQRIIHLDIKPQNILLDEHFNAKVSDFGLSKLIDRDESQVQTTMRGTPGYLAPEWRMLRITVKVDIYSFGIVLLEIVCGRRNLDSRRSESSAHLLRLLQKKANEDKILEIVENLNGDMAENREEVGKMIKIGAWCLQDDYAKRPSMSTVVKVLEGVMEIEPNISYSFTHANGKPYPIRADGRVSSPPPQASVLSNPR